MGSTLALLLAALIGLGFLLFICAVTEPPWELFRPKGRGLGYLLELGLAAIVFVLISGLALGALSSI